MQRTRQSGMVTRMPARLSASTSNARTWRHPGPSPVAYTTAGGSGEFHKCDGQLSGRSDASGTLRCSVLLKHERIRTARPHPDARVRRTQYDLLLICLQIQTRMSASIFFLTLRGVQRMRTRPANMVLAEDIGHTSIGFCLTAEVRQTHNNPFLVQVHGAPRRTGLLHGNEADTLLSQAVA